MTNYDTLKEYEAHKEPLPSYEEWQDIIQQNVNQEAAIETYIEDIKRLQEQLNDANEIIADLSEYPPINISTRELSNALNRHNAKKYLEKWGIK